MAEMIKKPCGMESSGLPSWLSSQESACNARDVETYAQSLGQEDPLEGEMATHSGLLPVKFHRQRCMASYSLWDHKAFDTTERLKNKQTKYSLQVFEMINTFILSKMGVVLATLWERDSLLREIRKEH